MAGIDESGGELLDRLANGDRLALARVTRLVTSRLRSLGAYDMRSEWDDICQEVVWALIRAVGAGRAPAPEKVTAYINRVTWNQFVNYLRKRGSSEAASARSARDGFDILEPVASVDSATAGLAETRFAARRALSGLPPEWQTLLVSHYLEGDGVEVLVASTGRSRATVNRDLRRAREAFRDLFAGRVREPWPSTAPVAGSIEGAGKLGSQED